MNFSLKVEKAGQHGLKLRGGNVLEVDKVRHEL